MTGQTITSRIRMTPAPGMVMLIVSSPSRLRKPTTPLACATIDSPFGGAVMRIVIAMRALLACDVRAAEAASSAFGAGLLDRVEAGGAPAFVWFACACPQAVAPARTTSSVMRRDGRTALVVAVKWAEVYTWGWSGRESCAHRRWRWLRGRLRVGGVRGERARRHLAVPAGVAGHDQLPRRDVLQAAWVPRARVVGSARRRERRAGGAPTRDARERARHRRAARIRPPSGRVQRVPAGKGGRVRRRVRGERVGVLRTGSWGAAGVVAGRAVTPAAHGRLAALACVICSSATPPGEQIAGHEPL